MARILSISSQVVYGPVGNTAAVPAMQAVGHEVMQIPTILLSHHPGHGKPEARATDNEFFAALLQRCGSLPLPDGVLTGYFASEQQVLATAAFLRTLKMKNRNCIIVVDPVIGDDGKLYVSENIASAIRNELLPLATATTPNMFELEWLSDHKIEHISESALQLGPREVIVTSVPSDPHLIGTALVMDGVYYVKQMKRKQSLANGSGDLLAGAYLAYRLSMPANSAFRKALLMLQNVITKTGDANSLVVAQALDR
jgi:pyridoxine kinase